MDVEEAKELARKCLEAGDKMIVEGNTMLGEQLKRCAVVLYGYTPGRHQVAPVPDEAIAHVQLEESSSDSEGGDEGFVAWFRGRVGF